MKIAILAFTVPISLAFQSPVCVTRRNFDNAPSTKEYVLFGSQRERVSSSSSSSSSLCMFGKIFGGSAEKVDKENGELAKYSKLGTLDNSDVKFQGLSDYIEKWSNLLENDPKGMGLTTPIKVFPSKMEPDGELVVASSGVRLVFKSMDTGYKSKKEEDSKAEPDQDKKSKNKKGKKKLEGGVEVLVEKLNSGEVRVRAQRCDVDEDTTIKEMSEEAILSELAKAIDVWKREK
eukprot:scaffold1469_cov119-Cylindrotheca_fusiformis.AAC.31